MGRKIKIRRGGAWVPADEGSLDNVIKSTTVDKISASTTAPSSPTTGDIWFDTSALPEELAPSSIVWKETPTGTVNGTNTAFSTAQPYVSGSLQVFINGLAESSLVTESSPGSGGFTLSPAPLTGDNISVQYQVRTTATGNADTLDGYHANTTATAGQLFPLVANTTDANGWKVYDYGLWKEYTKLVAVNKSIASGGFGDETITTNLPSAMATLGSATVIASIRAASDPQQFVVGIKASSTSTSLILAVKNIYTTSVTLTGDIHVRILG